MELESRSCSIWSPSIWSRTRLFIYSDPTVPPWTSTWRSDVRLLHENYPWGTGSTFIFLLFQSELLQCQYKLRVCSLCRDIPPSNQIMLQPENWPTRTQLSLKKERTKKKNINERTETSNIWKSSTSSFFIVAMTKTCDCVRTAVTHMNLRDVSPSLCCERWTFIHLYNQWNITVKWTALNGCEITGSVQIQAQSEV